jgi:hypothetical protein
MRGGIGSILGAGAACLALLLLAGGAARAEGERGRFSWHPSLRVTGVADDNVRFQDSNRDGALGIWVAPRLELEYQAPILAVGADLGVDYRYYGGESSPVNGPLYRAVGWGDVGLGHGLSLGLSNAFVPQAVRLGLPEDDNANLVQSNRADADLSWRRELRRGHELAVGIVGTHFLSDDYAEPIPLQGGGFVVDPEFEPNYVQGLLFTELQSLLGERTEVFVRGQAARRDYTRISLGDNTQVSGLTGVRSQYFRWLDLELSGGGGALFFDDETAWRAQARLDARTRLEFGLSLWLTARHLSTPDLAIDQTHQTSLELGFEQRFGPATALKARVFATRFLGDARGPGGNLFGAAEVGLRRQLTEQIQVGLAYRHWRNAGSLGVDDFNQNRIGLDFGFRL